MDFKIPTAAFIISVLVLAVASGASTAETGRALYGLGGTPGDSADVLASFDLGVVALEDLQAILQATEFQHPSTGPFVLELAQDPNPVNVAMGWYDEQDNLVMVDTIEFVWQSANPFNQGRITASEAGLGGYLVVDGVDLEISGEWIDGNLQISLLGAEQPHLRPTDDMIHDESGANAGSEPTNGCDPLLALTTFAVCDAPDASPFGVANQLTMALGDIPTTSGESIIHWGLRNDGHTSYGHHDHDECDTLMTSIDSTSFDCGQLEETAPDVPVGDDHETTLALTAFTSASAAAANTQGTIIKVFVVHEDKATRASSNCSQTNDKVLTEANLRLECKHINAGTLRHYQGTGDGADDWQDFINDYFVGLHQYRATADAFNGGRFVTFLPNEGFLDSIENAGLTFACEFDWTARSNKHACGFAAIVARGASYFGHSASYAEGLFFTHELVHQIGVISSETDDGVHDNRVARKNYNGKEGCYGWGNDFTSHNTFYQTIDGEQCDHMHYWFSNEVECYVQIYADYHSRHYPVPSAL